MKFTNKHNLPDWVAKGLSFSNYNRDGIVFDISATKLIDSPQIAQFWREHGAEVVEDVSDRVWSAFGSAVHYVFEDANTANPEILMEKRFTKDFDGKIVSAQIDAYEPATGALSDLKTCSVYKILKGDVAQWEKQLNVGAHLMRANGYEVKKLQIVAIVKDWSRAKAGTERNYPKLPITVVDIPLWTPETAEAYIRERLEAHFGDGEKKCSDEDRWTRPGRFAVLKAGQKRALRLLDSREQAIQWIEANVPEGEDVSLEERKPVYTRCDGYCPFVKFCKQAGA